MKQSVHPTCRQVSRSQSPARWRTRYSRRGHTRTRAPRTPAACFVTSDPYVGSASARPTSSASTAQRRIAVGTSTTQPRKHTVPAAETAFPLLEYQSKRSEVRHRRQRIPSMKRLATMTSHCQNAGRAPQTGHAPPSLSDPDGDSSNILARFHTAIRPQPAGANDHPATHAGRRIVLAGACLAAEPVAGAIFK